MKVSLVPVEHLGRVWIEVAPLIQRAVSRVSDRYELEDVFELIASGIHTLWIVFDENTKDVHCAFVTTVHDLPKCRVLFFEYGGGDGVDDWIDVALPVLEKYAMDIGCSKIEGHGRRGWKPRLVDRGWKETFTAFEKNLEEESE